MQFAVSLRFRFRRHVISRKNWGPLGANKQAHAFQDKKYLALTNFSHNDRFSHGMVILNLARTVREKLRIFKATSARSSWHITNFFLPQSSQESILMIQEQRSWKLQNLSGDAELTQ